MAAVALLTLPGSVSAIDFTWVGPHEGNFRTERFWTPYHPVPRYALGPGDGGDTITFNRGASLADRYTVRNVTGTNEALYVTNDSLRLEIHNLYLPKDSDYSPVPGISSYSMIVGMDEGDVGDLVLTGTPGAVLHSKRYEILGRTEGSTGRITVTGAGWLWDSGQTKVGFRGNGRLTIENGGTVDTGIAHVGMFEGASGTAMVTGVGSSWTLGALEIAHHDGTVIVEDGAALTTNSCRLDGAIKGELIIRGAGSSWSGGYKCFIGYSDTGILRIEDGAVATATGDVSLASWEPEGTANAVITGTGSRWDLDNSLGVSGGGKAIMTIEDGGKVASRIGWMAWNSDTTSDARATVVVNGAGSAWNIAEDLAIGIDGTAGLIVSDGGELSCAGAWLGQEAGSLGTIAVRGADSRWSNDGEVFVGSSGEGVLTVEAAGRVDNNGAWIGTAPGSTGAVTVRDGGSAWTNDGQIIVGYRSVGSLHIEAGGRVTGTGDGFIGFVAIDDTPSAVEVSGEGSQWLLDGELTVAHNATGALHISDGGRVENTNAFIGRWGTATGSVRVNGTGSEWLVRGNLRVGDDGAASLTVQSGGLVTVTGMTTIHANGLVTGDGEIARDVTNAGTVAPETSLEALEFGGTFVQDPGGSLRIELASPDRFARLRVEGDLGADGTLEVVLVGDYVPTVGTEFEILSWGGTRTGTFAKLALPDGVSWDTSRLYDEGLLVAGLAKVDRDEDLLFDNWELSYVENLELLDAKGDYDNDGQSDQAEQAAGTDPTDPTSALRLWIIRSGDKLELHWTCVPTREYTIQACANPGRQDWQSVRGAERLPGNSKGELIYAVIPNPRVERMFWRIAVSLP